MFSLVFNTVMAVNVDLKREAEYLRSEDILTHRKIASMASPAKWSPCWWLELHQLISPSQLLRQVASD